MATKQAFERFGGAINWFPGHMAKATRLIREQLKDIDMILEVRDARIPFSSANPSLEEMAKTKKRIVIFNKADLADKKKRTKNSSTF